MLLHNYGASFNVCMMYFQVVTDVRKLSEKLLSVKETDDLSISAQVNATLLFSTLLRATLCSKRTAEEHKLSQQAFEWVLGEIEAKFQQAKVHTYNCRAH